MVTYYEPFKPRCNCTCPCLCVSNFSHTLHGESHCSTQSACKRRPIPIIYLLKNCSMNYSILHASFISIISHSMHIYYVFPDKKTHKIRFIFYWHTHNTTRKFNVVNPKPAGSDVVWKKGTWFFFFIVIFICKAGGISKFSKVAKVGICMVTVMEFLSEADEIQVLFNINLIPPT